MTSLPKTMKAIVVNAYQPGFDALTVEERPVPQPGRGQVLVRVAASPINPSDLMFVQGIYGFRKPLPAVAGFEASGTIVAKGPGAPIWLREGAHVAAVTQRDGDGTWAEYVLCDANSCLPVFGDIDLEQASMLVVNPMTAWALVGLVKKASVPAFVQNAAAGALGGMLHRYGEKRGLQVINVVRRAEQVEALRAEGRAHVLNSSDEGFDEQLKTLARELNARIALDAVAGPLTNRMAAALPRGGQVIVYGGLSGQTPEIGTLQLIFRGKTVTGFWLSQWIRERSPLTLLLTWWRVNRLALEELRTPIRARYPLEEVHDALTTYSEQMSGGKVLFIPKG